MTPDLLIAPHVLEYPYRRSVGPVIGRFFAALKDQRFEGVRMGDGRILVPPLEYDPATGESLDEFVAVGPGGGVTTWAWVTAPRAKHRLQHPFAWALVRLDGADTGLLHMVDAGDIGAMRTGMRVRPRWRAVRTGDFHDLECFEPETAR
jgi:uncharacterized OB-fold protein